MAILAAYVQRQRTGEGQVIELSMQEVMTMFIRTTGISGWELDGPPAPRVGNGSAARRRHVPVQARSGPTTTST